MPKTWQCFKSLLEHSLSFYFVSSTVNIVYIRSLPIKRDWFCRLYCKNSYLEIRKFHFHVLYMSKNLHYFVVLVYVSDVLQNYNFYFWRCKIEKKKHCFQKFQSVIKHVKTCSIQKLLFLDFFAKYFLENVENR